MKQFLKSFLFAIRGVKFSIVDQRNLKVQTFIAFITIAAGFYFRITLIEWCIVLITIGLVIGLEIINTAIENLVDLVTTEWKPLAGRIKDMAAGAVLTASVIALVVGVIVFRKYCVATTILTREITDSAHAFVLP
ncbi:MAG TPA: diacylglycerol kinase family protein [Chryseosolibacter sp.]|nr:diacylglycerol kinase family protein [Chryseosolibacter sp.]